VAFSGSVLPPEKKRRGIIEGRRGKPISSRAVKEYSTKNVTIFENIAQQIGGISPFFKLYPCLPPPNRTFSSKLWNCLFQDAYGCDSDIGDLREHQQTLSMELEQRQVNCNQLETTSDTLDGDVERLMEQKQKVCYSRRQLLDQAELILTIFCRNMAHAVM
jgi:hypothetical protein